MPIKKLSDEKFIRLWNSSRSVAEAIWKTGMTSCVMRASIMRRQGFPVKRFSGWHRWQPEWDTLIGTMSPSDLAVRLKVSVALVEKRARQIGKAKAWLYYKVRERQKLTNAIPDDDFVTLSNRDIAAKHGIANLHVAAERVRRKLVRAGKYRTQRSLLVEAAIAGMRKCAPDAPTSVMAEILHVTRERIRQIEAMRGLREEPS